MSPDVLSRLFAPDEHFDRLYGVTVALVTNNKDPEKLGRVKLKFPWLSEQEESAWARVLTPMAGKERGIYALPEVDDEVLVAFEQGQIEFPYVLGALWNGKDAPPETNADGANNRRVIKSRCGHIVRLDDTDGSEKIEIVDKTGSNSIVFDSAHNTLTISAQADITIQSTGGKLVLSAASGVELKSKAGVTLEAGANMSLSANGTLAIQGSMVNIN